MPISGYDPEDIDDALEANLEEDQLDEYLTESERETYRAGDANLIDLLESEEIRTILGDDDGPVDAPD